MLKIVGVQRKSGEFQGIHYDNIIVHVLNDDPKPPCIAGSTCESIKIKVVDVPSVFGGLISTDSDYRSLIGIHSPPLNVIRDIGLEHTAVPIKERSDSHDDQ